MAHFHSKFARDETFVTGIHEAVDHNGVVLADAMQRLMVMEQRLVESAGSILQLAADAEANDERLDAQLRVELNAVTSQLGDELRAENTIT